MITWKPYVDERGVTQYPTPEKYTLKIVGPAAQTVRSLLADDTAAGGPAHRSGTTAPELADLLALAACGQ